MLPDISKATLGAEHLVHLAVAGVPYALLGLLLGHIAWHHDARSGAALRTFMLAHGSCLLARGLCFSATQIPPFMPLCTVSGLGCFARILSVESIVAWLSGMSVLYFFGHSWRSVTKAALVSLSLAAPLTAVANRTAYTFEVILGVWLAHLTFGAFTSAKSTRALEGLPSVPVGANPAEAL